MKSEIKIESGLSIGSQLAAFLTDRREVITEKWVATVERDAKLPTSDTLTQIQLRDHLPQLFENLSTTLRHAFNQEVKVEAAHTAAQHGEHRWSEGYNLTELLREFAHVRTAFISHLVEFEEDHPHFGAAARTFAHVTFHRFFDDAIRNSVEKFQEEQQKDGHHYL
jgi:RsbT co-antagonist protein rsbRD N-terminal domain